MTMEYLRTVSIPKTVLSWYLTPVLRVTVSLVILTMFGLQVNSAGVEKEKGVRLDAIVSVRCKIRCLALLQTESLLEDTSDGYDTSDLLGGGVLKGGDIPLMKCLEDPQCEQCMRPCNQPYVSVHKCGETCNRNVDDIGDVSDIIQSDPSSRKTSQCQQSCQLLNEITSEREGTCPSPNTARGFSAICVEACTVDQDCRAPLKCCSNGCGRSCRSPGSDPIGVPAVPEAPIIKDHSRSGSIEIRWNGVAPNSTLKPSRQKATGKGHRVKNGSPSTHGGLNEPDLGTVGEEMGGTILYIVESRWNIGPEYSEDMMTSWQQIAQTLHTSLVIEDITPGHWYQYRVTAVNVNGSRGSSAPSLPYTPPSEPRRPDPPANVTEGDTLIMGGKVAVNLHWSYPQKSDLPVSRYKITWSKKLESGQPLTNPAKELRHFISGDLTMYQLPELDPDSTYQVQIQAISNFGEEKLKSDRVSMDLRTYPLSKSSSQGGQGPVAHDTIPYRPQPPTPEAPRLLRAGKPFYSDASLKINLTWRLPDVSDDTVAEIDRVFVFWSPEACIADTLAGEQGLSRVMSGSTTTNSFTLYGLRFDCRYLVRVHSVTRQGVSGETRHLNLATPSCYEVDVTSGNKPDCPNSVFRVPGQPESLEHSFVIISNNITARLTWDKPNSDAPILGYRVIWGQLPPILHRSESQPTAQGLEKASMITKVIPRDARQFVIGHLVEGVTYRVQVQALSRVGAGPVAVVHFTTPLLQAGSSPKDSDVFVPLHPPPIAASSTHSIEHKQRSNDASSSVIGQYYKRAGSYYTAGCIATLFTSHLTVNIIILTVIQLLML